MPPQNIASWLRIVTWSAACVLSPFVCTDCATAYTPPLLTAQHPAHPEAMAASEWAAYSPF
jgi:hypothetical protein